jgi:hypothetical protein
VIRTPSESKIETSAVPPEDRRESGGSHGSWPMTYRRATLNHRVRRSKSTKARRPTPSQSGYRRADDRSIGQCLRRSNAARRGCTDERRGRCSADRIFGRSDINFARPPNR